MSLAAKSAEPVALHRLLTYPAAVPARGSAQRAGVKRIVVSVEQGLFDRVAMLAAASRVPFAEAVRQLLERGLEPDPPGRRRR